MKHPVSPVATTNVSASLTLMMQAATAEDQSNCVAAPQHYPMHQFPIYQGQMTRPGMPGFGRPGFPARPEFSRPDWVVEIEKESAQRRSQPFQSPAMHGFGRPERPTRPEFSRPDWVVEIEKESAQRRAQPFQSQSVPGFGRPAWAGNQLPGHGRGFGYARGQDSWWDVPPAPPIAPVVQDTAPGVEEVLAEAPVEAVVVNNDVDKDGILNEMDFCLETPAGTEVDSFGCSKQAAIVLRGVNFHTDSDQLTDSSTTILDKVVKTLVAHPELKVEVAGHTDSDGEDAYNKDLSQRRAATVVEYLVTNQVKPENLTAKGYGETMPMADNDTPEGKALNRRVELNRLN